MLISNWVVKIGRLYQASEGKGLNFSNVVPRVSWNNDFYYLVFPEQFRIFRELVTLPIKLFERPLKSEAFVHAQIANLVMSPEIHWLSLTREISILPFFNSLYEPETLLRILLEKCRWLLTSSTSARDFLWKLFLVCKLHSSRMTKLMTLSFVSFYQELSLAWYSASYNRGKLKVQQAALSPTTSCM